MKLSFNKDLLISLPNIKTCNQSLERLTQDSPKTSFISASREYMIADNGTQFSARHTVLLK